MKPTFLVVILLLAACQQEGSPFFAQALQIGHVAVAYDGDRTDGVVLDIASAAMPGRAPSTIGEVHVDGAWRSVTPAGSGDQMSLDPGQSGPIPMVGLELHTDGALELAPASQRQQLLWCSPSAPCRPLAEAVRDPELFVCFGKAYDGTYPPVECWQEGLTLDVAIQARPATRATEERRMAVEGGAFFPGILWNELQALHLASSSYSESSNGEHVEVEGCRGDADVTVALARAGEAEPFLTREANLGGDILDDGYLLVQVDDYAPPGDSAVAVTISTEKCLGGWRRGEDLRLDAWPLNHCGRVWTYATILPTEAIMCQLPDDPCGCAAAHLAERVCFRFGKRQLCSTPE